MPTILVRVTDGNGRFFADVATVITGSIRGIRIIGASFGDTGILVGIFLPACVTNERLIHLGVVRTGEGSAAGDGLAFTGHGSVVFLGIEIS